MDKGCLISIGIFTVAMALWFLVTMLFGWITMLVFHAFGMTGIGYWPCVGVWFLLATLFNLAKTQHGDKK